jgi:membrane-associated phospholipid phosphatase
MIEAFQLRALESMIAGPTRRFIIRSQPRSSCGVFGQVKRLSVIVRYWFASLLACATAVALSCLASICAYGINDQVLKPLFGVQPPAVVLDGARHTFNLLAGFAGSSFPSGHMVLAGAFAGVFMRLYRASLWPLCALLLIAAILLVVGDWHFLSDVIAGTFLGVSAGILAGEGWAVHSSARP